MKTTTAATTKRIGKLTKELTAKRAAGFGYADPEVKQLHSAIESLCVDPMETEG